MRRTPAVQALQQTSPHRDFLTKSRFWAEINQNHSHGHPEIPGLSQSPQRPQLSAPPRKPSQWTGNGHGARHINDEATFNLWDPIQRTYRDLTRDEIHWVARRYNATKVGDQGNSLIVRTSNPPPPVPYTIGGKAVVFLPEDVQLSVFIADSGYGNPRMADPYHGQRWGKFDTPSKSCMIAVRETLQTQMNVRTIIFSTNFTVVELVYGDGRTYARASLPAWVAGIATSYHHKATPFLGEFNNLTRERFIDPQAQGASIKQDTTDYLRPQNGGTLMPGVRVSTTRVLTQTSSGGASKGSTLGLGLQRHGMKCVTVSNHSFQMQTEVDGKVRCPKSPTSDLKQADHGLQDVDKTDGMVWHPESPASGGKGIGLIVDRYLDLDIAMVKLSSGVPFTNRMYFLAERPRFLKRYEDVQLHEYYEVDGMSTGMITLQVIAKQLTVASKVGEHTFFDYFRVQGETNRTMAAGMCGAPIVDVNTGGVAGFFHLASLDNNFAVTEALDQLIDDGWTVIP